MGDEREHDNIAGTVSRFTPLARDGSPDSEGAGVFGGVTTRVDIADGLAVGPGERPLPPLRAIVSVTVPDLPDPSEIDYRFGHPLQILGDSIGYLRRNGSAALEIWSPIPAGDGGPARTWRYWLLPWIDFAGYGVKDFSYTIDEGTVRFSGGLRHGDAWRAGVNPVYAREGEPPRHIEPMPAHATVLALVTATPPPPNADYRERLIRSATNLLGA